MNILSLSMDEVNNFVDSGFMKRKEITHWQICRKIADGITQDKIAEFFDITPRAVRKVKKCKCPNVGILPGYRTI